MIKFEREDARIHVEASGELVEILADVTVLLKVLYEHLDEESKYEFRFVMSHALAEDDFPAWDGKPLPGTTKWKDVQGVKIDRRVLDFLEAMKKEKEAADESGA